MSSKHIMSIMKRKGRGPALTIHFAEVFFPSYVDVDLVYSSADWEACADGLFEALVHSAQPKLLDQLAGLLMDRKRERREIAARIKGGG